MGQLVTSHPGILILHRLVLLSSRRGLFKQWKQFFLRDEMLYILFLFHPTETNRAVFALLFYCYNQQFIAWQSTSLVTTYSCILYQISCHKFHTDYRPLWLLLNALLEGISRKSVVYLLVTIIRQHFYHARHQAETRERCDIAYLSGNSEQI